MTTMDLKLLRQALGEGGSSGANTSCKNSPSGASPKAPSWRFSGRASGSTTTPRIVPFPARYSWAILAASRSMWWQLATK